MKNHSGVGRFQKFMVVMALFAVPVLVASCESSNTCKKTSTCAPYKSNGTAYNKGADCKTGTTYKEGTTNRHVGASPIDWNNLTDRARRENKPVYLYFTAPWCPNCRTFERDALNKSDAQRALDRVIYMQVNIDRDPDMSQRFNIQGVPTGVLLKYQNGKLRQIDRHVGGLDREAFINFLQP